MSEKQRHRLHPALRLIIVMLGICILSSASAYAYETFPRFIKFSFPPPQDDYSHREWSFPTYAIWRNYSQRYFVFRTETALIYEGVPDQTSRQIILDYFNDKLSENGWVQSEYYAPCRNILPEASFIHHIEDASTSGYIIYHRKDFELLVGGSDSEFVCLAIWNDTPGIFSVVLMTAKPSPLTLIMDALFWRRMPCAKYRCPTMRALEGWDLVRFLGLFLSYGSFRDFLSPAASNVYRWVFDNCYQSCWNFRTCVLWFLLACLAGY